MKRKGKYKPNSIVIQILIAMPILTILFAMGVSKLILSGSIAEEQLSISANIISGLVSFLLSGYCAIRVPQKKALWAITTSCTYAVTLLLGNLLFFGVAYEAVLPTLAVVMASGCAGALLGGIRRRHYA